MAYSNKSAPLARWRCSSWTSGRCPYWSIRSLWTPHSTMISCSLSPALPNDLLPNQNTDSILQQQQNGSCITSLLQEKPILRCSTILDEYDVYAEIVWATCSLHLLRVQYMHIKGHQDKNKPVHTLTKPTQYNISCNKWAHFTQSCTSQHWMLNSPNAELLSIPHYWL